MRSLPSARRWPAVAAALCLLALAAAARADASDCGAPFTPIPAIQGPGASAALTGVVVTEGVVVGDFEGPPPSLGGFYLQDPAGDGDPASSDALFVFHGDADSVSTGRVVRVAGSAGEHQGQTEIAATLVSDCGAAAVRPRPVELWLPRAAEGDLEPFEGMLVRLPQRLTVTESQGLGRFGELVLSSSGRLWQPTQLVPPGPLAIALAAANARDRILLDDATQAQNPDPIAFGPDGLPLSAAHPLRAGDTVAGLVGVLGWGWGGASASPNAWRVRPLGALGGTLPIFSVANPRPAPPPRRARLRAAGANLANYFTRFPADGPCTGGVAGAPLECRGAGSPAEFARQWPKTLAMLLGLDADLLAVAELANDGYGPESAIAHLTARLDEATGPGAWAFVDADAGTDRVDALGSDAIKVGLLYRRAALAPVGAPAVLATGAFGPFLTTSGTIQRNRPALAQGFAERASGERFTAVAVHLKSRGSSCRSNVAPVPSDPDTGDGQGHCARTRLAAAVELAAWLAGDPTGLGDPDVLVLGDWNAYPREGPIAALLSTGFRELLAAGGAGPGPTSYGFQGQWGRLDHALASPALARQAAGAGVWAVNADEPAVLDYRAAFETPGQIVSLYAPDAFRAADHDPVWVDLALPEPVPAAQVLAALAALAALAGRSRARPADTGMRQRTRTS